MPFLTTKERSALEFVDPIFKANAKPIIEGMNFKLVTSSLTPASGIFTVLKAELEAAGIKEVKQVNNVRIQNPDADTAFVDEPAITADGEITVRGETSAFADSVTDTVFVLDLDVILA